MLSHVLVCIIKKLFNETQIVGRNLRKTMEHCDEKQLALYTLNKIYHILANTYSYDPSVLLHSCEHGDVSCEHSLMSTHKPWTWLNV